ncbi:hypothetical protein C2S52_018011 [Perilla frutescens var. hirtella]|nr:hypothetical protein C2S52_018011 [Perilla frutescens var. hirtella]
MAPVFGTIDMLKPGRSTFGLELRLIRYYENSNSGGIECIFHDRQAERIHVTIPGSNSEKSKHRLIEGSVYALIDFVIVLNIMKYRTTSCIHKIIVFKHTRLFEVFHEEFPKCLFELKTFTDIAQMENVGDSAMFDVIGTIVSHYRPQHKEINGKMDILLEDVEGNTITCTIWEHYVDEVIKFLDSGPEAPVGIIMQLCRANIFRGEVRVSTLFNVTKILTDQKLEDIKEFTFGYLTTGKVRSSTISTLTSSLTRSLNDEIKDGDFELKTISEILSEGNFVERDFQLRYKLDVEVGDGTGETILDMWDIQGLELIGKKPPEDQVLDILPTEIDEIVGAKGFFKIIVMHEKMKGPFIVVKVTTDEKMKTLIEAKSVRRSKGKRKMHGDADEAAYICDAFETPLTMKSTTDRKDSADLINEDETNRKLIDEFSSNALKKRQKRNVKKE